jgi:hypothetical protein
MRLEQQVTQLLEAKAAALVSRSKPVLTELLDEKFAYINSVGEVLDRGAYVSSFCDEGGVKFIKQSSSILRLSDFGEFATAVLNVDDEFMFEGKMWSGSNRALFVFVQRDGRLVWCAGQTTAAT